MYLLFDPRMEDTRDSAPNTEIRAANSIDSLM